jgi:hypothetical protein
MTTSRNGSTNDPTIRGLSDRNLVMSRCAMAAIAPAFDVRGPVRAAGGAATTVSANRHLRALRVPLGTDDVEVGVLERRDVRAHERQRYVDR